LQQRLNGIGGECENHFKARNSRSRKDHRGVDLISDALLFTTPSVIKPSYKNHKPYDGRPSDRESNEVSNVFAHLIFRFILDTLCELKSFRVAFTCAL
jgi:hypothetical protein